VNYYCSTSFSPTREHGISVFDPELALPWPDDVELLLSDRDRAAPSLAEVREAGLLPSAEQCDRFYARLRAGKPPNQAGLGQ
jgi:dTDP-4-dehydrorhamnose 3,5-epimerase